ncbi:MAG: signal peptidase I [bacterium]
MARQKSKQKPRARTAKQKAQEWIKSIIFAVIIALLARATVVQAFRIPTSSMEDTLLVGDFLFVNKFIYGIKVPFSDLRLAKVREPRRGDIVVFKHPGENKDFIKRCIGIAGDTVEIKDDVVYINNIPIEEPYKVLRPQINAPRNYGPIVVPKGHIFVLGDNRHNSYDSRSWGPLDMKLLKGQAMVIYFSWDHSRHIPRFNRIGKIIR